MTPPRPHELPPEVTMSAEGRLEELGLVLPGRAPEHATAPSDFQWAGVRGDKAWASGHEPLATDGTPAGPFGSVPREVSLEDAQASAGLAVLDILGRLGTALGDLDA